jgi:hypothetical protein
MTAAPSWPRVLLRSEDSNHHLSVIETAPAPGVSPPLHSHDFDETFYVFAPRGVPHTDANLSGAPAHQLIICTPAGFERYFERMAAERQGTEPPEWARQPLPEVTALGPPIDPEPASRQF